MFRSVAVLLFCSLFACAQVRVGEFSRPYLKGTQPDEEVPTTGFEQDVQQTLEFEGYRLRVTLNNDIQTSETLWFGVEIPLIPLGHDGTRKWRRSLSQGPYCLNVRVETEREGGHFLPRDVVLEIDGQRYTPSSAKHSAYGEQAVPTHQVEPGESVALSNVRADNFTICFEVDRPEPASEIHLQLGEALVHPDGSRIPAVFFVLTEYRSWL